MDKPHLNTHLKLGLKHHEISIQEAVPGGKPNAATPLEEFSKRKMRYTVSLNGNYQTRETTCGKFSSEIAAFIREKNGILIGVDGVNGYACGPTDEEILFWAHPFDEADMMSGLVP